MKRYATPDATVIAALLLAHVPGLADALFAAPDASAAAPASPARALTHPARAWYDEAQPIICGGIQP